MPLDGRAGRPPDPDQAAWVEELALALEALHIPRMGGRILGHLLVCDEPHQSLDDLALALRASKASMSTTTRLLTGLGYLEPVAVPGQRRDHYRIRAGAWLEPTRHHVALLTRVREISERRLGTDSGDQRPVAELRECCTSLEAGLRDVLSARDEGR